MSEEVKEKKLTKEQKKDLKLKEKFKEIDKKFKRVDKLYKLSTEFEGFRNEEFNQLKESLCNQIDQHVDDKISQFSHEIMTDIRDHQLGTLPIVSSKEAIRILKKEVDELKKTRTKDELLKFLIFFIALNFGLTIFLLINFFMVFDF